MLAEEIEFVNVDGIHTYQVNTIGAPAPLSQVDFTVNDRSNSTRYKMQMAGSWPTRSYEGDMSIHIEGSLFSDTSEDYWTERTNLLLALRGVPGIPVTNEKRGTVYIKPSGATERWYADYGPLTTSLPIAGNYPSLSQMLLTLGSFLPYMIGEDTGDFHWVE